VYVAEIFQLILGRKQRRGTLREARADIASKNMLLVTYFLQLGPTSYLSIPPNNATILGIHQGMNYSVGRALRI
jgi:hypothetical protein